MTLFSSFNNKKHVLNKRTVKIVQVEDIHNVESSIVDSFLDSPQVGKISSDQILVFKGWILTRGIKLESVQVTWGHHTVDRTNHFHQRPDVLTQYNHREGVECYGFHLFCNIYSFPVSLPLFLEAVLENGETIQIVKISISIQEKKGSGNKGIAPCLLISMDRSGSTFLMNVLSKHLRLTCYDQYPFEGWSVHYWMRLLLNLNSAMDLKTPSDSRYWSSKIDNLASFHNRLLFDSYLQQEGINRWLTSNYPELLSSFCHETISSFYQNLSSEQQLVKPRFFIEKARPSVEALTYLNQNPKCKKIIMVRDFRDYACSYVNFFGLGPYKNKEEMIREKIVPTIWRLYETYFECRASALLIRYEDLIADPASVISNALNFLEVDASPGVIQRMLNKTDQDKKGVREKHVTAKNVKKSVGRWKSDLSVDLVSLLEEIAAEPFSFFNYTNK